MRLVDIIARHVIVAHGMTLETPDRCSCGTRIHPHYSWDPSASLAQRRARAYALHVAERIKEELFA